MENEKRKRKLIFKKANLATWSDDGIDSDVEEALLCFMALKDESNEAFDSNLSNFNDDNDMDDLYHELYDSLVKAKKDLKMKIIENELLL